MELKESPDYDTLGGLILNHLQFIPDDGSQLDLEAEGLLIHVEIISGRRIQTAFVEKQKP